MDDKGVLYYLVAGPSGGRGALHALQFACSLFNLRKVGWDGPVHGLAGDAFAEEIFSFVKAYEPYFTYASMPKPDGARCYGQKSLVFRNSPFGKTLFLDCDTLPVGHIGDVWPDANQSSMVFTAFSNWLSTGRKIRGRIEQWRDKFSNDVDKALKYPIEAINTGVFSFDSNKEGTRIFFERWLAWCRAKPDLFIGDETAAQVLIAIGKRGGMAIQIVDDRYNLSVKHGYNTENPVIWHGHGRKFFTTDRGRELWLPAFAECWRENYCSIKTWGSKYMPRAESLSGRTLLADRMDCQVDPWEDIDDGE